MTRWHADIWTWPHGALRAGWLARTVVIVAVSALPGWAQAQQGSASHAESSAREALPEWKRLKAEVERLHKEGRYEEAIPLAERAALLGEKALGPNHLDVAQSLNDLAVLYDERGRYGEGEPLHERALGIREKALGPHHPDVAISLNNLAWLYHAQGRYGEAEPLYQRALSIREKALGAHHPRVAESLNNLAWLYKSQGRYAEAEPLYRRALSIREKALGTHLPYLAESLNNLAVLYKSQGRYAEAEPLYQRALSIREKALGAHHPDVATSLNNLAVLYVKQGRYGEAEPLYQRALGMIEKALGPHHPHLARSLNNLASLYVEQGRYREAEPLYQRALGMMEKALGPHHPDIATMLDKLALLYESQGRYGEAELLYQRALGIYENQRALGIRDNALGTNHPDAAQSLNNLARLYLVQKDIDQAITYAERAELVSDEHLSAMMRHGSEHQKHAFMAMDIRDVDFGVTLALRAPVHARAQRLAMRRLLRRKGRVLDAMRSALAAVRDNLDEEGRVLLDRYLSIRSQYSTQYLRAPQSIEPEQHRKNLAELEQQKRETEVRLSEKSAQFAEVNRTVTLEDIQHTLPEDAVLVEWIRYEPWDPSTRIQSDLGPSARYAACVLPRRGAPTCMDLNDAKTIDAAALAFHRAVALGLESRAPARKLDALIMAPVRRMLGGARTLYLSPDGALQFIPFAALLHEQEAGSERYLVEEFELVHVTSGRDLVRAPRTGFEPGPVTVLGDPRYSAPGTTASMNRFPRLFGTRLEAEELGALLPGARLLVDDNAVESAVKNVRAPWIMHLATHAYFGGRDCTGKVQATDNPLLAAGLALAGANACDDGSGGDGILTGEEMAGLDLYGTQLVVLSACDTGIGALALSDKERLLGERDGVYGLRRALMLAGAETQVVSLWKVNDVATRELMGAYYRELFAGRGRAEALRRVQLAMLRSKERAHPYYWASFAVVGMKDPLRMPAGMGRPALTRGPRGCACEVGAGNAAQGWGSGLVLALAIMAVLRSRRRTDAVALVVALALAIALLAACGGGRPPVKTKPQRSDESVAHLVLDWSIGPTRAPPPSGRARLLWHTPNQVLERARPVTSCEENAQSILPAPDGKRVYLAVGGAIFFVPTSGIAAGPGGETLLTPLAMSPPGVHVRRLLAFVRESRPLGILAQVEEGETARETLWLFRIQGREAVGRRIEKYSDFVDALVFYRRFDNPRCQAGERDCIVVSAYGEDTIVSVEGQRGSLPRAEIEGLGGVGVVDMAWARAASNGAQWVLHRCSK